MAFTRVGYGQVEPNQLSAQKNGQIYASLPLDENVEVLQNGEFMYYDYKSGKVTADGVGEPMLVFNEVKLYEPYNTYKDFALFRVRNSFVTTKQSKDRADEGFEPAAYDSDYRLDSFAPRLFKTSVGDVMTTNMVNLTPSSDYQVGDYLAPVKNDDSKTLVLDLIGNDLSTIDGMAWVVAKKYTMPDGQPGLKLQRVQ